MFKVSRHLPTMSIVKVDNGYLVATSRLEDKNADEFGVVERQLIAGNAEYVAQLVLEFFGGEEG